MAMFLTELHGFSKSWGWIKLLNATVYLFYLAVNDRKFAIIGDGGINAKVPAGFWDDISELLKKNFKEGKFTEGLSEGILLAGKHLKIHFPHNHDDVNELADEISFDK